MLKLTKTSTIHPDVTEFSEVCCVITATLAEIVLRCISLGLTKTFKASVRTEPFTPLPSKPRF